MNDITPRKIKTGSDPRALPDYAALRDELSKLTHPARPDVNWPYAERLCLALFEQNGMELQTLTWYTLARMQLGGLGGLNEGLTLLKVLISQQWGVFWPQPVHARMAILNTFSQRVQQRLRALPLRYGDLNPLYHTEQLLSDLGTELQRLELKHLSQLETLRAGVHQSAVILEKRHVDAGADVALPSVATVDRAGAPDAAPAADKHESMNTVRWTCVAQPEHRSQGEAQPAIPASMATLNVFMAGMGTMLVLGGVGLWGWQKLYPDSAMPVPVVASATSLKRLEQMPLLWRQEYGFALAARAAPEEAEKLQAQWLHYISGNALPAASLSGWHQGMEGLAELTQRLNALDERKKKYLTGSELKSMVFAITQNFMRSPPVEEHLYQLSQMQNGEPPAAAQIVQTDNYLNQLLNRYMLIKRQSNP